MQAAQTGDIDALDALLRRHYDRVRHLTVRMMGDPTDGADAAQEALIAIARGIKNFDGRSAFTTWLYRVTTNACLDELRRRARRPRPADTVATLEPMASLSMSTDGVADRLDIDRALGRVPIDFRTAVVLRDVCELDYAEIAEVLGIPPGTVRSRIARGRAQLTQLLAGNQIEPASRPTERP